MDSELMDSALELHAVHRGDALCSFYLTGRESSQREVKAVEALLTSVAHGSWVSRTTSRLWTLCVTPMDLDSRGWRWIRK